MTKRAVTSWAEDVMHGLSESEAKGWEALDFHEVNAIPEVEMQHYARRPQGRRRDVIVILPATSRRNVIASDCVVTVIDDVASD
jgi:hypothetical protein